VNVPDLVGRRSLSGEGIDRNTRSSPSVYNREGIPAPHSTSHRILSGMSNPKCPTYASRAAESVSAIAFACGSLTPS
jgi:hypothetical protein